MRIGRYRQAALAALIGLLPWFAVCARDAYRGGEGDGYGMGAMTNAPSLLPDTAVWYVSVFGNNAGGTNWATAFTTVTQGLAAASHGEAVWVAAGVYSPGPAATDSFNMKSGVKLYGGFTNGGSMGDRDWANNPTVLDGGGTSAHVVYSASQTGFVLDGFTIRGGNTAGNGAGVYIDGGSFAVNNCVITNNTAAGGGGMSCVNVTDASAIVSNCTFAANYGTSLGGAVYNDANAYPVFAKCVFRTNRAGYYGGAVFAYGGTLRQCDFIGNYIEQSYYGGGICCGGNVSLTGCTFIANRGAYGAAFAHYNGVGTTRLINCSFSGNAASVAGGAVRREPGGATYVTNCIFWGDTPEEFSVSGTFAVGYSDVQGGYAGTSNINVNPLFANPNSDLHEKSRGGRWTPAGWASDAVQSPCIDAGDASPYANEPLPSGGRINMGAYGNTAQASKSSTLTVSASHGTFLDKVSVTWTAAASATGYQLWRSTNVFDTAINLWNGSALTCDDFTATAATAYYYWVLATNASGIVDAGSDVGYRSAVYYVRTNGDDTANGLTWETAFQTLTNALNLASAGQIWVAAGTYSPGPNATDSFDMKSSVSIYGGFTNGMGDLSQRNWTNNATILDGANVNTHVVRSLDAINALLDGFTITRGKGGGAGVDGQGGGMYLSGGSPRIYNCLFTNNTVVNGTAATYGGALAAAGVTDSSSVVSNCTFVGNSAYIAGGAVYVSGGTGPTFRQCIFRANTVTWYGGGAYLSGAGATIDDCTFIGNASSGSAGGGLYHGAGTVATVSHCVFIGNSAVVCGGMYVYNASTSAIVNCSFAGNTGNSGGGIYVEHYSGRPAAAYVTNTILWGDTSPEVGAAAGSSIYVAYSDVQGGSAGTSNINVNPLYADAASDLHEQSKYGRWTPGGWVIDGAQSPCIDAGDPGMYYSQEPFDNGKRINMGAYGNTPQASKSKIVKSGTLFQLR